MGEPHRVPPGRAALRVRLAALHLLLGCPRDATLTNGCLAYLPGTHRQAQDDNAAIGKQLGALFDAYPQWRSIDPAFCPVPAGSAVVHNGLIAHGAGANMTQGRRGAMTAVYMADGTTFDRRQFAGHWTWTRKQHATYELGAPLDDDEHFPIVYRRDVHST